ncbi:MAG: SDR family oxidoreductase [bacterium]
MLLKNKTAIITGAGGGIGSAIATTLAKEGCNLVLIDRTKETLDRVSKELEKYDCEFLAEACDIREKKEIDEAVSKAFKKFSQIDILVNAAGVQGPLGPFINNEADKWIETINVNLNGTMLFIKAVLPIMTEQGFGKIINFSGGGAFNPRPNFSAYAVSKAAVVRLTETLAEELKEKNIQVNAIAPGGVNTEMLERALEAGPAAVGNKFYEKAKKQKEEGGDSPQLAADLILFLCSEKSYNLSGKAIHAKLDNWREWDEEKISKIMSSDLYTLRIIL